MPTPLEWQYRRGSIGAGRENGVKRRWSSLIPSGKPDRQPPERCCVRLRIDSCLAVVEPSVGLGARGSDSNRIEKRSGRDEMLGSDWIEIGYDGVTEHNAVR